MIRSSTEYTSFSFAQHLTQSGSGAGLCLLVRTPHSVGVTCLATMTRSSPWSIFLLLSSSTIFQNTLCQAHEDVSFQLAHSWAFPEVASSSMILHDTEAPSSGLEGLSNSLPSLRARTVKTTIRAPSRHSGDPGSLSVPVDFFDELLPQTPVAAALTEQGVEVFAPNVSDRSTLLNLARASWDAYHSTPTPDRWYDIDGMNWVRFSFLYLSSFPLLKFLRMAVHCADGLTDGFVF